MFVFNNSLSVVLFITLKFKMYFKNKQTFTYLSDLYLRIFKIKQRLALLKAIRTKIIFLVIIRNL